MPIHFFRVPALEPSSRAGRCREEASVLATLAQDLMCTPPPCRAHHRPLLSCLLKTGENFVGSVDLCLSTTFQICSRWMLFGLVRSNLTFRLRETVHRMTTLLPSGGLQAGPRRVEGPSRTRRRSGWCSRRCQSHQHRRWKCLATEAQAARCPKVQTHFESRLTLRISVHNLCLLA